MAKTPAAPVPADEQAAAVAAGKGRATPTRAEQEAARRRPLVADTKEAKARARAELNARRERARQGMAAGDERFLPARDKGPQRRFVRDFVDSGWHLGEFVMPMMVVVIIATFIPLGFFTYWSFVGLWIYILFVIGDMIILSARTKKRVGERFGADNRERGVGWYAAMRSMQMRFMRLPKPQVRRGRRPV